jgi:hypothetical protein
MALLDIFKTVGSFVGSIFGGSKQTTPRKPDVGDDYKNYGDNEEGFMGYIKRGARSIYSSSQKEKPPSFDKREGTNVNPYGAITGVQFNQTRPSPMLPGMSNPYIQSLYRIYDTDKLRQFNRLNREFDIYRTPQSEGPRGPTVRL